MIERQMPRIRLGSALDYEEGTQALALTYLSNYNTQEIATRVETAYKRAFAMDSLSMIPDLPDSYVGACVAMWLGDDAPVLHIAIPGVNGISAILGLSDPTFNASVIDLPGSVYRPFSLRASALFTRVFANPQAEAIRNHPRGTVCVSGFSLGGACAEIIACMLKRNRPDLDVRCIKFGSPRVGTSRWVNNRNRLIKFASVYNNRDPIHFFPWVPVQLSTLTLGSSDLFVRSLARDDSPLRLDARANEFSTSYLGTWGGAEIDAGILALRAFDYSNPWYDHSLNSYRLNWMTWAAAQEDSIKYRFNYLEHNDENAWHIAFTPGMTQWEGLGGFVGGGDAEVPPISASVNRVVNAVPAIPTPAPIMQDDGLMFGPFRSDFSRPPVASTDYRPVRRVRRVP